MGNNRLFKGYWWLPSSPDDKVAGVLTVEPNGKVLLELMGAFDSAGKSFDFESNIVDVIYGRCYAPNNNMKDISLMDCRSAITYNFSSSFPLTRYTCIYALIGIHAESMDSQEFFKADVSIDELVHWCRPRNVVVKYDENTIGLKIDTTQDKQNVIDFVDLDDGTRLSLTKAVTFTSEYPKIFVEQATRLEILKEGMSAGQVLSKMMGFENFLSVATLSYPLELSKVYLYSRKHFQDNGREESVYHPVELVTPLYRNGEPEFVRNHDFLFSYDDVKGSFQDVVRRFYSDIRISQIWNNLICSLEKKRVYSSGDFLVVAQALDGFAIRFRKETDFQKQLKSLRDEFKSVRKLSLTDDDLKAAKGSRDYYSHILRYEVKDDRKALDGSELFHLTEKLRVLLICCVLNYLGFDNEKIDQLLNKCCNPILDM